MTAVRITMFHKKDFCHNTLASQTDNMSVAELYNAVAAFSNNAATAL